MAERTLSNLLNDIKKTTSMKPNLLHLQKLQEQLICLPEYSDQENNIQLLMECILKYIDFTINVSSNKELKDQIKICKNSFGVLPDIISETIQTAFVRTVTKKVFDIIIEDDVKSWCVKKQLLKAYNICIQKSHKEVRQNTVNELPDIYLFKMVDSISTYGDYDLQVILIETVFRMYGKSTITSKLKDLIPESQELSQTFAEINGDTFDEDVRNFLNALNETSGKVFSIICKSIHLGGIRCEEPMGNINGLWIDFNLSEKAVTWYCNKHSFCSNKVGEDLNESANDKVWDLITLFASDVESVQSHRPINSQDVLVYFKLKGSCISCFKDDQAVIASAEDLTLVIAHDSKTTSLLSKVLPQLFKNKFLRNSSKVSSSKKAAYKPLNIKVSKFKSDSSRTKSDTSSFITVFDPICRKNGLSDTSQDNSLHKRINISSPSSSCEVISISESTIGDSERSIQFLSTKVGISQNMQESIDDEYETAQMCLNPHQEINPNLTTNKETINTNELVPEPSIDYSPCIQSFNDELDKVQEDIDKIQILSGKCSRSRVKYIHVSTTKITPRHSSSSSSNEKQFTETSLSSQNADVDKNEQTLIKASKISEYSEILWENMISQERIARQLYTENFETAHSQISNKPLKVSISAETFNKTESLNNGAITKKLPFKTGTFTLNTDIDEENTINLNSLREYLRKRHGLVSATEGNKENVLPDGDENISDVVQDAEEVFTSDNINKPTEFKQIRKRKGPALSKKNNTQNENVLIKSVVESTKMDSKREQTCVNRSTATKKRKQIDETKLESSLPKEDSGNANVEEISITTLKNNLIVKLELLPSNNINANQTHDSIHQEMEKNDAQNEINQTLKPKQNETITRLTDENDEDDIPLKQLIEKWKKEKRDTCKENNEFKETDECKETREVKETDECKETREVKDINECKETEFKETDECKKTDEFKEIDNVKEITHNQNKIQMFETNCSESITTDKFETTRDFNQTTSTTLGARKKRKLFNPDDLSYLAESTINDLPTGIVPIQLEKANTILSNLREIEKTNDEDDKKTNDDNDDKKTNDDDDKSTLKTLVQLDEKPKASKPPKKVRREKVKRSHNENKDDSKRLKKLKIVNPYTTLTLPDEHEMLNYRQLRPVFYNMLETFRKEAGTSLPKIMKDAEEMRKNTKNKPITTDFDVHTRRSARLSSSSADPRLNVKRAKLADVDKTKKNTKNKSIRKAVNTRKSNGLSNSPPNLSLHVKKEANEKNHQKKINIISDILIRPQLTTDKEETVSENEVQNNEISSWNTSGNPNYDYIDSARYQILKYLRPTFQNLLTPQNFSQEYHDILTIHNVMKKYH